MRDFVNLRTIQEQYREQHNIKQRMPPFPGTPCILDNGDKARIEAVYIDGSVQTTSGDVYPMVVSNGHQLHVVNREPMPFKEMTAYKRLRNMGFSKPNIGVID